MINAGELRHRIVLQQPVSSAQDAGGQPTIAWTTKATVWAAVKPLQGREFFSAEKVNSDIDHRIVIRYYAGGITPSWRVQFGTRIFQIQSIIVPNETKEEMQLMCKETINE